MGKKLLTYILVIGFFFSSFSGVTTAHPLDISSTVFSLGDNTLQGTTYFHSYEIGILLSRQGKDVSEIGLYNQYLTEIETYFRNHFSLKNKGTLCTLDHIEIPEKEGYEILAKGLEIRSRITCPESLESLEFHMGFFTDFPLQTNRLSLVARDGTELYYKVGTTEIQDIQYDIGKPISRKDQDQDGLDDEEEHVYKTLLNNKDTDGDYYLDGEEVNFGWNPISALPSPGQTPRTTYAISSLTPPSSLAQSHEKKDYSLANTGLGGDLFQSILRKIGMTVSGEEKTSFFLIFLFTVGLGFLHALGPGHAKGLLASIMVQRESSFLRGLRFIFIFSLTHIIDIFVLFLALRFFLVYIDTPTLLLWIQRISALILFPLGVYLLYRAYTVKADDARTNEPLSDTHVTMLAVIAGLAPCSFGWSLFFMLISLGKIEWIPPLIFAIALGIFLCLLLILLFFDTTKKYSYARYEMLARFSNRLSALLIFVIGCIFIKIYFFA